MKTLPEARKVYAAELLKLLKALPPNEQGENMAQCLSLLDEAGIETDLQVEKDPAEFVRDLFSSPVLSPLLENAIRLKQTPEGCLSPDELVQRLLPADGHLD